MLRPESVREFKLLYLKEYGIRLSNKEALRLGSQLIKLVRTVYGKDIPKKWIHKIDRSKTKD